MQVPLKLKENNLLSTLYKYTPFFLKVNQINKESTHIPNELVNITKGKSAMKVNLFNNSLSLTFSNTLANRLRKKALSIVDTLKDSNKVIRVFQDGGCDISDSRKTGSVGLSVYLNEWNLLQAFGNLGEDCTNNIAEYFSFIMSLLLLDLVVSHSHTDQSTWTICIFGDSELVLKQMKGQYKVKTPHLGCLHTVAEALMSRLRGKLKENVFLEHVKRHLNSEADRLAVMGYKAKRCSLIILV